jgi:hypothetical protein
VCRECVMDDHEMMHRVNVVSSLEIK